MGYQLRALAITCLLAGALYFTYGQFSLDWITVLPIVFALAVCALPTPRWFQRNESSLVFATALLFLLVAAISLLPENPRLRSMIVDVADTTYLPWIRILFAAAAASLTGLFVVARLEKPKLTWSAFALFLVSMVGAFALIMSTSPRAQIDVWTVHEEGAAAFIEGKNPYLAEYTNIYPEELRPVLTPGGVTYSYLPGTFMWMSPWKALGLDTRYSQLVTRSLMAILLALIAWRARSRLDFMTFIPSVLWLTFPLNLFFIVRAWNDDISLMFYTMAAWGLLSRRPWAFFLACNALLVLKHHAIFFVPMLIWLAWRIYGGRWWNVLARSVWAASLIHAGYLLADWRNYLGSLYGLTFLKYPEIVHHVFPDRRDPFSLMNYLYLYTGFKTSVAFVLLMLVIAALVVRSAHRTLDIAAVLRGLAAMAFAMFIFGPVAFANYYEFALGLTLIAAAASVGAVATEAWPVAAKSWEFRTDWWLVSYVATRAAVLFIFSELIIETRYLHSVADMIFADRWPYRDFSFNFLPFALIPSVVPKLIQSLGGLQAFIGYHSEFQLVVLVFDVIVARFVFQRFRLGRTSKTALAMFIFGPLLVAPVYLTSATVVTISATWILLRLFMRTNAYATLKTRVLLRRRFYFAFVVGALLTACALIWGLSTWAEIEFEMNPLLSPTTILIWMMALAPLLACQTAFPRARAWAKAFGVSFAFTLALTFFLLLSIEAVFDQKTPYVYLMEARNALIMVSLALFFVYFYRSRVDV